MLFIVKQSEIEKLKKDELCLITKEEFMHISSNVWHKEKCTLDDLALFIFKFLNSADFCCSIPYLKYYNFEFYGKTEIDFKTYCGKGVNILCIFESFENKYLLINVE